MTELALQSSGDMATVIEATWSGRSFTFTHSMGLFCANAAAIFCISGESLRIFVWQFMHVLAAGMPATVDLSADE